MSTEKVIINNFGETAEQIVLDPSWRSEFQQYKIGYEQAENKEEFNAKWFKEHLFSK